MMDRGVFLLRWERARAEAFEMEAAIGPEAEDADQVLDAASPVAAFHQHDEVHGLGDELDLRGDVGALAQAVEAQERPHGILGVEGAQAAGMAR